MKDIINKLLDDNFLFDEISPDNDNYGYYMVARKELDTKKIESFKISDIRKILGSCSKLDTYVDIFDDIDKNLLYKSVKHGFNHNVRVFIYALIICINEGLSDDDIKVVLEGAKYHDIGRINDLEDSSHGVRSAEKLDFLKDKYSDMEIKYLKTIVIGHSLNDEFFEKIAMENEIIDLEKCKKMFMILKDADALDRVRLEYPYVDLNYLRTDTSLKLVLFSYQLYYNYWRLMGNDDE